MNYDFVTGGPCEFNCQAKYCDQSCPHGGCTITCPSDNKVCQQMCGPGKQCTKEIMPLPTTPATTTVTTAPPFVPDECDNLEDGVCYQFCPEGSCVLECFNSTYYNSCAQSCNGEGLISVIARVNFLEFVSQKVISLI